jgi:hypothetical protein
MHVVLCLGVETELNGRRVENRRRALSRLKGGSHRSEGACYSAAVTLAAASLPLPSLYIHSAHYAQM